MKENIILELQRSINKLENLRKNAEQVQGKIILLEESLKQTCRSLEREFQRIENLGLKQPSRDPEHPDTPEEQEKKNSFNESLSQEKDSYLQENLPAYNDFFEPKRTCFEELCKLYGVED